MIPEVALHIYQGDDFSRTFGFEDEDGPMDLSGWSDWRSELRDKPCSDTLLATFTVDDSDAENGIITLSLDFGDTDDLAPTPPGARSDARRAWWWDLEVVDGDGKRRTLIRGPVFVTAQVTKPEES